MARQKYPGSNFTGTFDHINGLEEGIPDLAEDYSVFFDSSAGYAKKSLGLGSGVGPGAYFPALPADYSWNGINFNKTITNEIAPDTNFFGISIAFIIDPDNTEVDHSSDDLIGLAIGVKSLEGSTHDLFEIFGADIEALHEGDGDLTLLIGVTITANHDGAGNISDSHKGLDVNIYKSGAGTTANLIGIFSIVDVIDGIATTVKGHSNNTRIEASKTVPTAIGYDIEWGGTGIVSTALIGIQVGAPVFTFSGGATGCAGIFVDDWSSLTHGLNLYSKGTASINYFEGCHKFHETSDFAAPATNDVVVYARDTGGKTELVARFPTGAIQRLAIEP